MALHRSRVILGERRAPAVYVGDGHERVRSPRGVSARAGAVSGRGSRGGRGRARRCWRASLWMEEARSRLLGRVRERRVSGRRRETPIGVPGSAGGTIRRSTPRRGPNRRERRGGTARAGVWAETRRARARNRGWTISRASRRVMTRAAKRARDVPMMVLGEAKGAPCWWWASRATAAGGAVYTFLAPLAGSARRAPASVRGLR